MNRFLSCLVAVSLIVAADASFARSSKKPEEAVADVKKDSAKTHESAEKSAAKSKEAASGEHAAPVKKAKKKATKKKPCVKDDRYTYPGTTSTRAVEIR